MDAPKAAAPPAAPAGAPPAASSGALGGARGGAGRPRGRARARRPQPRAPTCPPHIIFSRSAAPKTLAARASALARASLARGDTWGDGLLLVAACQIGQIMLVLPRAFWLAGVAPGLALAAGTGATGAWTVWVMLALYLEFKRRMVSGGGGRVGSGLRAATTHGSPPRLVL